MPVKGFPFRELSGIESHMLVASDFKGWRRVCSCPVHQRTFLLSAPVGMAGDTARRQGTHLLVKAVRSQVEVVKGNKVVFKEAQE